MPNNPTRCSWRQGRSVDESIVEDETVANGFCIKSVKAREILDSRGLPTVEVDVTTEAGILGRADTPAGTSRGRHEAFEIRDGGGRYDGYGVEKAVKTVDEVIAPMLRGMDVREQREVDQTMIKNDGTEDKSHLGGNSMVAVSWAVAKAAAHSVHLPLYRYIGGSGSCVLPVPMFLYITGGSISYTDFDFQEFNAMPIGAKSFAEAMCMGSEVYRVLGRLVSGKYGKYALNTSGEGSYSPHGTSDPRDAFEVIMKAIEEKGYQDDFVLYLDAASTHLYDQQTDRYRYRGKMVSREQLFEVYEDLAKAYPLKSIEDPVNEDDYEGFAEATTILGVQIVGDDLFVSNLKRLMKGVSMHAANSILLKVNQVGTLTEALETASYAKQSGYSLIVSERSGQTEDTWLADLTVATNAGQIKNGTPTRGERTAQFNQLMRIEEELGKAAKYAGRNYRKPV
jgi:enolase